MVCAFGAGARGLSGRLRLHPRNTFLGDDALISNTTGTINTAIGWQALDNTTGNNTTGLTQATPAHTATVMRSYSNTTGYVQHGQR